MRQIIHLISALRQGAASAVPKRRQNSGVLTPEVAGRRPIPTLIYDTSSFRDLPFLDAGNFLRSLNSQPVLCSSGNLYAKHILVIPLEVATLTTT